MRLPKRLTKKMATWHDVLNNNLVIDDVNNFLDGKLLIQVIIDEYNRYGGLFRKLVTEHGLRLDRYIGDMTLLQYAALKKKSMVFFKTAVYGFRTYDYRMDRGMYHHYMNYIKLLAKDMPDKEVIMQMIQCEIESDYILWDETTLPVTPIRLDPLSVVFEKFKL